MTRRLLTLLLCLATLLPCIARAQDQFKVLVVATPNRYHHDYTVVAKPQFERMAQRHGVDLTWSWNSAPFDGDLSPYAAIVLLNTPGDELKAAQRTNFETYVRKGGGVVAVHRTLIFNPPGEWPRFERLIGRTFRIHPMVQTATVRVEDGAAYGEAETNTTVRAWRVATPPELLEHRFQLGGGDAQSLVANRNLDAARAELGADEQRRARRRVAQGVFQNVDHGLFQ